MKRMLCSVVAAVLMIGSTQSGVLAQAAQPTDYWIRYTSRLPIGQTVNVRTTDGKRTTGVLAIVDDTGITLQPKTRVPEPPRHIPFTQLQQVELRQNGSSSAKAAGIGVAVGVGTFFALLAILASAWD
jgi:hypothetical protein